MKKEEFEEMVVGNITCPTRWFSKNTKVYVLYVTGNPDSCMVIGKARGSKGAMQKIWIRSKYIGNARIKKVVNPYVLREFVWYHGRTNEEFAKYLNEHKVKK